jgi:hypothetical protein
VRDLAVENVGAEELVAGSDDDLELTTMMCCNMLGSVRHHRVDDADLIAS